MDLRFLIWQQNAWDVRVHVKVPVSKLAKVVARLDAVQLAKQLAKVVAVLDVVHLAKQLARVVVTMDANQRAKPHVKDHAGLH